MATTLQQLLHVSGDAVAGVLDTYRQHNGGRSPGPRPLLLDDVKDLLRAMQTYEDQILQIDCAKMGAVISPLPETRGLFEDCHLTARHLQLQIRQDSLRDDTETRNSLRKLTETVSQLIIQGDDTDSLDYDMPAAPDPPPTKHNKPPQLPRAKTIHPGQQRYHKQLISALPADDVHSRFEDQVHENRNLTALVERYEYESSSRLNHVQNLYSAVARLNVRFPPQYTPSTWDELTRELPRLIDHLNATDQLLRQLEIGSPKLAEARPLSHNFDVSEGITSVATGALGFNHGSPVLNDLDINIPVPSSIATPKPPLHRDLSINTRQVGPLTGTGKFPAINQTPSLGDPKSALRPRSPTDSSTTSTAVSSFSSISVPSNQATATKGKQNRMSLTARPAHKRNQSSTTGTGAGSASSQDDKKKEKRKSGRVFFSG